jgi:hypothetical protein
LDGGLWLYEGMSVGDGFAGDNELLRRRGRSKQHTENGHSKRTTRKRIHTLQINNIVFAFRPFF